MLRGAVVAAPGPREERGWGCARARAGSHVPTSGRQRVSGTGGQGAAERAASGAIGLSARLALWRGVRRCPAATGGAADRAGFPQRQTRIGRPCGVRGLCQTQGSHTSSPQSASPWQALSPTAHRAWRWVAAAQPWCLAWRRAPGDQARPPQAAGVLPPCRPGVPRALGRAAHIPHTRVGPSWWSLALAAAGRGPGGGRPLSDADAWGRRRVTASGGQGVAGASGASSCALGVAVDCPSRARVRLGQAARGAGAVRVVSLACQASTGRHRAARGWARGRSTLALMVPVAVSAALT